MAWELRDGNGTLWPVPQRGRGPSFEGDMMWNGQKLRVVAWKKPMKNGGEFLSLSIKVADEQRQDASEDESTPF